MGISLDGDPYWMRWIAFVREAMACLDIKRENDVLTTRWMHLPGSGGYYDQDEMIMTIWEHVRKAFLKAAADEAFTKSLRCKGGGLSQR